MSLFNAREFIMQKYRVTAKFSIHTDAGVQYHFSEGDELEFDGNVMEYQGRTEHLSRLVAAIRAKWMVPYDSEESTYTPAQAPINLRAVTPSQEDVSFTGSVELEEDERDVGSLDTFAQRRAEIQDQARRKEGNQQPVRRSANMAYQIDTEDDAKVVPGITFKTSTRSEVSVDQITDADIKRIENMKREAVYVPPVSEKSSESKATVEELSNVFEANFVDQAEVLKQEILNEVQALLDTFRKEILAELQAVPETPEASVTEDEPPTVKDVEAVLLKPAAPVEDTTEVSTENLEWDLKAHWTAKMKALEGQSMDFIRNVYKMESESIQKRIKKKYKI